MRVSAGEPMRLKKRSAEFILESDHLIQKLRIFDMIALLIPVVWKRTGYHLLVSDILEVQEITLILI